MLHETHQISIKSYSLLSWFCFDYRFTGPLASA